MAATIKTWEKKSKTLNASKQQTVDCNRFPVVVSLLEQFRNIRCAWTSELWQQHTVGCGMHILSHAISCFFKFLFQSTMSVVRANLVIVMMFQYLFWKLGHCQVTGYSLDVDFVESSITDEFKFCLPFFFPPRDRKEIYMHLYKIKAGFFHF